MQTKTITRPTLAYLDVAIAQAQLQGWRVSGPVVRDSYEYKQDMVKGAFEPGPSETKKLAINTRNVVQ